MNYNNSTYAYTYIYIYTYIIFCDIISIYTYDDDADDITKDK